jgi:uncharacterized protein
MLMTVADFRQRVSSEIDGLVSDLRSITGRVGEEEAKAWRESLPKLAKFLRASGLQALHLHFSERGALAIEYQLPASGLFADAVLLGAHNGRPSAVIIELKNWVTRTDRPGKAEGLIERRGYQELHPSDQVRGYVNYCRYFHSGVQDLSADVQGCVLFTADYVTNAYVAEPNKLLAANFPIFTTAEESIRDEANAFFTQRLTTPHPEFAAAFDAGNYRQQRGFIQQIARQVQDSQSRPFELLDNQRLALNICKTVATEVVSRWTGGSVDRRVVTVIGPPGSGKSAVAARLWAEISLMDTVPDGDIVFTTTSMSQSTNWHHLFNQLGTEGARGVLRKATGCYPISTHRVGQLRRIHGQDSLEGVSQWRDHLLWLAKIGEDCRSGAEDKATLVNIVDEAHSLINTEADGGVGQFGFPPTLGPQAYHLIRSSVLTIFFLDPQQGFRHRENTSLQDIKQWASELGAGEVEVISLEGVQFRCAGSVEYVSWVESLLAGSSPHRNQVYASAWLPEIISAPSMQNVVPLRRVAERTKEYSTSPSKNGKRSFDFRVFENPHDLETHLRQVCQSGETMRLLSSYSRKWVTTGQTGRPHLLPPSRQDFYEEFPDGTTWSRVWNVVQGDDYTSYVQGSGDSQIAIDPLSEVGCPYAVRGFDYDYIGILWLEDLVWRNGKWSLNLEVVEESGLRTLVNQAKHNGPDSPEYGTLLEKVSQAYRILMTRALRGTYVWVKDAETRTHVMESLGLKQ